jgi:hypothetical protein
MRAGGQNAPKANARKGLVAALSRLRRDDRGVTAVLLALTLSALIGLTGLGVETGLWYAIKRQDQSAADAAALSGAFEVAAGKSDICALAQSSAVANNSSQSWSCTPACTNPSPGQMCANNPPVLGGPGVLGNNNAVEVILAEQQSGLLASVASLSSVIVTTRAVARVAATGVACDLALATTGSSTIKFNGNPTVDLTSCGMADNSNDPKSVDFTGTTNFQAAWFQTVGNYQSSGKPNIPIIKTNSFPVTDPYSCNPPQIGCSGQIKYTLAGALDQTIPVGAPLQPGVYSSSSGNKAPLNFTGGTYNLCPGVYYLDGEASNGASFAAASGAMVQLETNAALCPSSGSIDGVTIISTCKSPPSCKKGGGFVITSGATVKLSAPTVKIPSGCTLGTAPCIPSGVLFFQDPIHADTGNSSASDITANSNSFLTGAIYAPVQEIKFSGNANSTCTVVIGLTLQFSGTTDMTASQAGCSAAGVGAPQLLNIALAE